MAINGGDGSIILSTKVDESGLKSWFASVNSQSKTTQANIKGIGTSAKTAMAGIGTALKSLMSYFIGIQTIFAAINFSKESGQFATQTEASVQRLTDIYGSASESVGDFIDANARAIGMSKASAASFASVYGNLFSVWADQNTNAELTNRYLNMTAVVASKTGRTVEDVQERVRSGLLGNTEAIEDLGVFVNVKTIETTEAFQRMADGKSWEQLDAYTQQQIRSMAILEQATAKYGNEVADTTATTRAQYQAAYEDFQNTWGQVVNTVLIPVLKVLTQVLTIATKGLQVIAGLSGKTVENTDQTEKNIEKQKKNQEELNEAVGKSLAGFDELNVLSEETADNTAEAGTDPRILEIGDVGADYDNSFVNQIDADLAAIMGIVGGVLIAVGLLLIFFGHIGWGIGFVIAGASVFAVSMATVSSSDQVTPISEKLMAIMAIAGIALTAIGLILLFNGSWKWGIGFIIAGAGALSVAIVAVKSGNATEEAEQMLLDIMLIAGSAMLALGVILMCFGVISPLSIGLVVTGAGSIAGAVAINPQAVGERLKAFFVENAGLITGISLALVVIGILVCFANLPLGIALIVAGVGGLITEIVLNRNAITDWLKGVWDSVKQFWNTYIAPVFTAKWWKDLGISCINGLIAGFEGGINGIIRAFEKLINWIADGLNEISFDIPDWLGGGTFGFDLSHVDFKEVKIPRLARGAVIPPNREFMAVLGDQKNGRNLEAPEDLIRQIVREETANNGGDININFTGSLSRLAQILQPEVTRENKRKSIFA